MKYIGVNGSVKRNDGHMALSYIRGILLIIHERAWLNELNPKYLSDGRAMGAVRRLVSIGLPSAPSRRQIHSTCLSLTRGHAARKPTAHVEHTRCRRGDARGSVVSPGRLLTGTVHNGE